MSVGAITGISLLIGSIGILTIMWIAVGERTSEIGHSCLREAFEFRG